MKITSTGNELIRILAVFSIVWLGASVLAPSPVRAETQDYVGPNAGQWSLDSNWSLGYFPNISEEVFSTNGTEVRIGAGTDAEAANLMIGGATANLTSTVSLRQDGGQNSLIVTGNITLAPGAGHGSLLLGVGTLSSTAILTIGNGSGSIHDGGGAGNSNLSLYGLMGTLGLANATFDRFAAGNSNGTLTIASGQTYTALTWFSIGSATANMTQTITIDGGTLDAALLRIGENAANGSNAASLIFNSGTVKAADLNRDNTQTTAFDWNGGTITHRSGGNLTLSGLGNNTLMIGLAGTGNHTFTADSGRTITVNSTAVLADRPGQNGTLTKAGAGTLILAGANTYSGVTTVNDGTLRVNNPTGSATGSGNVTVNGNGTLGGTGSISGNALVETNGGFAFALSTAPGSHDRLDITGALTLNGTTNLTITSPGNATTGNYTLLAAAGGITGSAPANLSLPAGWNATTARDGSSLYLNVTSIGGGGPSANVTFTSSGQAGAEGGSVTLTVTASGSPSGTLTANVTFDSGNSTAASGDVGGFSVQTVTLNASNSYTANVTVNITNDSTPEAAETAVFALGGLTGSATLGSPATHTVNIAASDSFSVWAAGYNVTASLGANDDADKFIQGQEYAFDLDPTVKEYGNVLASQTSLAGGNITLTLAFNGNSSKEDINYVVRRANNPAFTANTVVGHWNGTANWTTSNSTYFANQTQSGNGTVKAINVNLSIPAASEPRQFLKVNIE